MAKKITIYIKIESNDRVLGWWTFDRKTGESYICSGKELWGYGPYGYEYCRGTPCTSTKEAKTQAKVAVNMANFDGYPNLKTTFWVYVCGKLTNVKI